MDYRTALWLAALALAPETLNGQVAPSTQTTTPLPSAQAYLSRSGTTTKASAEDYPVHAKLEKLSIGAEYMVHSFSSGREMFIAKDYLVVEVALFPAKGENLLVNAGQFTFARQWPQASALAAIAGDRGERAEVSGPTISAPACIPPRSWVPLSWGSRSPPSVSRAIRMSDTRSPALRRCRR